jgi:hypothetical protein
MGSRLLRKDKDSKQGGTLKNYFMSQKLDLENWQIHKNKLKLPKFLSFVDRAGIDTRDASCCTAVS